MYTRSNNCIINNKWQHFNISSVSIQAVMEKKEWGETVYTSLPLECTSTVCYNDTLHKKNFKP